MNRSNYFNYIEEKLNTMSYRIKIRGRINLLDLNIYSESFFADLLNLLLNYNLKNLNRVKQNTEGIDLIDEKNKVIAQVSSTSTKQKVENSLAKQIFVKYSGYHFIFIAIAGDADNLRGKTFRNPHGAIFSSSDDIYDVKSLLSIILDLHIAELRKLYGFIRDELGNAIDIVKVDTNLASVINLISQEDLSGITDSPEINPFEISRKIEFNSLISAQHIVKDFVVYFSKVNEKYKEFDKQGANKSFSILALIRSQYNKLLRKTQDPDEVFFSIIENVIELIQNSKNYIEIPYDELELCVSILVVDAFTRCKIFKNPEGYNYVATR